MSDANMIYPPSETPPLMVSASERAAERLGRLHDLALALTTADTAEQVADVVCSDGFAALDAPFGSVYLRDPGSDSFHEIRCVGTTSAAEPFPLSTADFTDLLLSAARAKQPLLLQADDKAAVPVAASPPSSDTKPAEPSASSEHAGAFVVLPLLIEDTLLGGLELRWSQHPVFDAESRLFMQIVAQMCAHALERARLADVAASRLAKIEELNARLKQVLTETHHRVKNNLQVISALVELQTDSSQPLVPADALHRVGVHARALSTLHDLLTDQARSSLDISTVSTRALFGKMLPLLQATIGDHPLKTQIEDARLPVRIGATLCLLANELVSNAVKHGGHNIGFSLQFEPDRRGSPQKIAPHNTRERRQNAAEEPVAAILHLTVDDDGPGFPPDFNPQKAAHTGLDLVSNLSRLDLNGSVTFANNPQGGARVTITFPLPA